MNRSNPQHGDPCHPLTRFGDPPSVAFAQNQRQELRTLEVAGAIGAIRRGDAKNETLLATPAFPWPVDVADPITAVEGRTYTQEGSNNFRMHNVVPDAVIGFQSNLGSQGGDVFDGISTVVRRDAHAATMAVRRLTPRECERLQGFPDDWTAITYRGKPAADGPRYKALGNSMAVNVMRWIGERIDASAVSGRA
jgi:DNA (cytosine-5)-methyltransferase 1